MQALTADSPAAAADYCRRARRIRASFARDPLLRQRALGELATRRNAQTQPVKTQTARRIAVVPTRPVISRPVISVIEQGFADYAATKIQPFGFAFCDRAKLLNSAEKLGITRFRANLILALQEHHAPARRFASPDVPSKTGMPSMLVLLLMEIMVVGTMILAWNLIHI